MLNNLEKYVSIRVPIFERAEFQSRDAPSSILKPEIQQLFENPNSTNQFKLQMPF